MMEGIVAVANLGGVLIKLNHILHNPVTVAHPEMFKSILGSSNGMKRSKVHSEFVKESGIGVLPHQWILQIWMEDVWFEPVKSGTGEKGNDVVDFVGIRRKGSGSVVKVQLEGDNESLEFP